MTTDNIITAACTTEGYKERNDNCAKNSKSISRNSNRVFKIEFKLLSSASNISGVIHYLIWGWTCGFFKFSLVVQADVILVALDLISTIHVLDE